MKPGNHIVGFQPFRAILRIGAKKECPCGSDKKYGKCECSKIDLERTQKFIQEFEAREGIKIKK